ncbi:MAG: hypothetical protein JSS49_13890 [Planctomycetes bacterium]|nr:hypothetical protein [Planctomycetota bacterium]
MNLLQGASDDQVALIGCLVALVGSVGMMYLSFFVGPAARKQRPNQPSDATIKQMPMRPAESPRERAA